MTKVKEAKEARAPGSKAKGKAREHADAHERTACDFARLLGTGLFDAARNTRAAGLFQLCHRSLLLLAGDAFADFELPREDQFLALTAECRADNREDAISADESAE